MANLSSPGGHVRGGVWEGALTLRSQRKEGGRRMEILSLTFSQTQGCWRGCMWNQNSPELSFSWAQTLRYQVLYRSDGTAYQLSY